MNLPKRFSLIVFGVLIAGALVGSLVHAFASPALAGSVIAVCRVLSTIFINLVKMIVAPLIFATLVTGIAGMGDGRAIARIALKAMLWFLIASIVSLALGTIIASVLRPGAGLSIPLPTGHADGLNAPLSAEKVFIGAFPSSAIDAFATNNILQVVVFAIFTGLGLAAIREKGEAIQRGIGQLASLMLAITGHVMLLAPIGVFAAVTATVAKEGLAVIGALAWLVVGYYLALAVLIAILLTVGWFMLGRRLGRLLALIRDPATIAFSTSSSEAAYPRLLAALESFGVRRDIVSLVLPLGYSFNLDASMVYCTFGALFIAQAYGIALPFGTLVLLMLMLMLASKGIAAVPRGSLIALAAVLPEFGFPPGGLLLLLGADHLLNMGRSGTNVLGNALAVVAVAKWEADAGPQTELLDDRQ
ncbi:dicarboxylate/amino acid:cation symporter [Sphingomonas sp. AP4-R1]|uniref:dicarboxylate/amino acid:cation symporter n=1 Tax=Sphingomonas sp. AP4-R1 TaxID=2735134 RepID=UPI001493346B|nr:dicarboxylate/amino acid:cation symporter [Sphingomonas sp. AP4-R1]QJU58335.1 dicarboxylate/amino acid:cation symporter [Sphingomonas sp. AP4-R1]